MIRQVSISLIKWSAAAAVGVILGSAAASLAATPSTPSTPSTEPAVSPAAVCPVIQGKQLPAGYPAMGAAADKAVPAGVCPANEGKPLPAADKAVPAGVCPANEGKPMPAGPAAMASAAAPATIGSIDLIVKQGTQGAPALGLIPVSVQLYQEGVPVQKFDVKLDASGHALISNVPLAAAVQPVVTIEHAGVTQQTVGPALDPANPKCQIVMGVYETATQAPAWTIAMRHVIVHNTPEGLQVTEMLSVNNPTDRIWLGATRGALEHVTLALPVPAGITNLELSGGFQEPFAKLLGDQVVSTLPMFPGSVQFQLNYIVPVTAGAAQWSIGAPAAVAQLIVFAPADQSTVTVEGARDTGSVDMGQGPMHMFRGAGIKAGQSVTLTFSGLTTPVAPAAPVAAAAVSVNWARNFGAIGVIAVVVIGSALLLVRRPKSSHKA